MKVLAKAESISMSTGKQVAKYELREYAQGIAWCVKRKVDSRWDLLGLHAAAYLILVRALASPTRRDDSSACHYKVFAGPDPKAVAWAQTTLVIKSIT